MNDDPVVFTIFLIFFGAAVLATAALYARQAILVSYILLGMLLGPSALGWVGDPEVIKQIAHIGIMFLLFLLGINLPAQKLLHLVRETTLVAGISSLLFAFLGGGIAWLFGYSWQEGLLVGAAMMFSSTIISIKLLPTTELHHKHTGEIIISVLLLQDVIAILVLLLLQMQGHGGVPMSDIGLLLLSLPLMFAAAYLGERYLLIPLIRRFDRIQEYIFLLAIGWCLGMAELASILGLSHEIGAFIGGVALATSPIALFIAESLKPLRDFFLVMFFFTIGAGFDLAAMPDVLLPAALLAALALGLKPFVFEALLRHTGEERGRSLEIGMRLGQMSEFSLLIAILALEIGVIGRQASDLIQLATLFTFVVSPYMVVMRYPTPVAVSDALRRD